MKNAPTATGLCSIYALEKIRIGTVNYGCDALKNIL